LCALPPVPALTGRPSRAINQLNRSRRRPTPKTPINIHTYTHTYTHTQQVFVVHETVEALRAFLLVPPVAKFTNDFRNFAREKADKVI
jgi:hypothetical protein